MWNFQDMGPVSWVSRDNVRKFAYHKVEILNGFCALSPRFGGGRAILTYARDNKKVFRHYVSAYRLRELFSALDNCCENSHNGNYEEYFSINHLEFHLERVQDFVVINVTFSTHKVRIAGLISQIAMAVEQFHHSLPNIAEEFELKLKSLLGGGVTSAEKR